jgi:NDP-sugar pyrophosphorylase family protein
MLKTMEHNDRYGGVDINEEGVVQRFSSAKGGRMLINSGCYLISRDAITLLLNGYPQRFSFEEDVLKPLAVKRLLAAVVQERRFLDIGLPESYAQAASIFSS